MLQYTEEKDRKQVNKEKKCAEIVYKLQYKKANKQRNTTTKIKNHMSATGRNLPLYALKRIGT